MEEKNNSKSLSVEDIAELKIKADDLLLKINDIKKRCDDVLK